ncbi:MAG: TIM barrel protein [Nitrospiraceae bacterium]|nr:TIM barrel protein [Nitrospiraceae bacterium]
MRIGMYSVTYRGVWYEGEAIDVFSLLRLAKEQGWEGVELDTERPHAAPMDLSSDDRKRLRDLSAELEMPICAVSPNCDLSSPVPSHRDAMICYVRECIKLAHDLGSPICKIFAAWRGITLHDGIATYDETYGYNQFGFWKGDRWGFVVEGVRELAKLAEDFGIVLAMQNHGPDVITTYEEVLRMIDEVGSPAFKGSMDINIEPDPVSESAEHAREMARACGDLQVHAHCNGEFARGEDGSVQLVASGYFDDRFWERRVAYPEYVDALVKSGYDGYFNWEFCHPAMKDGQFAGIDYVHDQTQMALEYLQRLRAEAQAP